jgi:hypothetical protein
MMNYAKRKLTLWVLGFSLVLTVAILPAWAKSQAASKGAPSTETAARNSKQKPKKSGTAAETKPAPGAASDAEIAAAKASGKVWVNLDSGIYHKSGRWYGRTKNGKFMTETEAKAAGYKGSQRD